MFMGTITFADTNSHSLASLIRATVPTFPAGVHEVRIESNASNAAVVYLGGPNVSTTIFGAILALGTKEIFQVGGDSCDLSLDTMYVKGTTNDKIHIFVR